MKANELRIGNYVQYPSLKNPIRVSIIDTSETNTETRAKPIPLTEEWMGDFGFKLFPWGFVLNAFRIDYNPTPLTFRYMSDNRSIEIKYIHQLQNLYFALTGEELQIEKL